MRCLERCRALDSASRNSALRREAAEETLRQRFAAGEIDDEEYARRADLVLMEKLRSAAD